MSSNIDALSSLRQAIKSKDPITYSNSDGPCSSLSSATHLLVSSIPLPKSSPTRYLKTGVTTASGPSDFFSVEAIYLAWLLRDAPGAEYMKQARENGLAVGFVSVTERKNVVDWLEGRVSTSSRIVPLTLAESTTPPGSPRQPPVHTASTTSQKPHSEHQSSSPSKRRYVADNKDIEVVKKIKQNEVELRDQNTVLRGIKPNNFTSIRTVYADKLKRMKESKYSSTPTSVVSSADAKLQARKARNNFPIIMISSSPTALITMHNVKRFLQESTFEPSQEARARAMADGNTRPEDMIPIYRKRTHIDSSGKETETQARYFVVDSVEALSKFGADAWDRVVCVMTTGQAWQFRPYKWNEPIQLFHHGMIHISHMCERELMLFTVKGIYVTWSNDPPNTKIKDWNVMELKVHLYILFRIPSHTQ
ncbi:hypothetical protein H0H81_002678 [Sphagnurus paluster]|uniref:Cell division control protein 73 C-terminal domain-containing protein n=1 Tax=Sphagnurus paluster TaxID=117069 RepID=A0A9P7FZW6_9AGAR|nr:hypothetical protein H0H81_002678 [Sphagnurus paluster]